MFFLGKSAIISFNKATTWGNVQVFSIFIDNEAICTCVSPYNAVTHPPSHLEQINVIVYIVKPEHFAYSHLLLTMY